MLEERLDSVVRHAASGDRDSFETLVHRFQDMAVGYAFSVVGDFHLAEDAAQEAFVQAHRDLAMLREPAAFPSWLRRLVFKHCDRLIRRRRVPMAPLRDAERSASRDPGPDELSESRETREVLRAAMAELGESDRQVLSLFYIAQYSQKEIAAYLDVHVNTIKQRLFRARRGLRKGLERLVERDLRDNRPSKDRSFMERIMQTIEPDKATHSDQIYGLLEVKGQPGYRDWREGRIAHSNFDWKTSRIGSVDGRVITVFGVYDVTMRIGEARVRVAGVNCDAIDEEYADREYELRAQAGRASFEAMRGQGYQLSVTFGEEGFFSSLGYAVGWRELAWLVPTTALPSESRDLELEEYTPEHRDDLAALYNELNESLTGTAVRPTYLKNKHPGLFDGWLWRGADGTPGGYVSGNPDGWFTMDVGVAPDLDQALLSDEVRKRFAEESPAGALGEHAVCLIEEQGERWRIVDRHRSYLVLRSGSDLTVYGRARSYFWVDEAAGEPGAVLQILGSLARKYNCEIVFFDRLHYRSSVGRALRRLPSTRIEVGGHERTTSYMVRIINLGSLLESLIPELSRRLRASHLSDWRGNVVLSSGEEEATLVIDRSNVAVEPGSDSEHAIRGGQEIARLFVGSEAPAELALEGLAMTGEASRLAEVLFPAQHPQMENQAL